MNGYLACLETAAENAAVYQIVADAGVPSYTFMVGGYQDPGDPEYAEPAGGWKWLTGVKFSESWTNWESGQPDNHNGNESIIEWHPATGQWNDLADQYSWDYNKGLIVEYVPEPATLGLLVLGVLGVLRRRV